MVQRFINNILGKKLTIDEKMRIYQYDNEHFNPSMYREYVRRYIKLK